MYSKEIRDKALEYLEQGHSPRQVSLMLGGSPSTTTIVNWAKGKIPTGKRSCYRYYSVTDKLNAIQRMENGEHYKTVAEDIGCNGSVVLTWRRIYREKGKSALLTRVDRYIELASSNDR